MYRYIQGQSVRRVCGRVTPSPNCENLPFLQAKAVVQCTFTGNLLDQEPFDQLLLLKVDQ